MSDAVKYQEIKQFVSRRVGQRLPSERELTTHFGISRPRLRRVLEALEHEGLVQRRHGSGTYALALTTGQLGCAVLLVDVALKLGDDPFFSLLLECLQGELQAIGAQCVVQRTQGNEVLWPQCDGVIALGVAALNALDHAAPTAQPAVGLLAAAQARPQSRLSLLELDDESAGTEAARQLIAQGVRQVFFFGRRAIPAVGERLAGVEAELRRAGVALEVIECGLNYAAGLEQGFGFSAPLGPSGKAIGVIAANDWLAVGLHTGIQSRTPALRRRVRLVSFDGLALTCRPELGIASLAVPLEAMAKDAVAELQRLQRPGAAGRAIRYALTWSQTGPPFENGHAESAVKSTKVKNGKP
ncbi:MAG: GntR family transcriptional regulator, transcriptional repressor for pyruvate dehydrogenase complex [Abditibacteriota bacterium]|jgi:DNA-binding LacI/PurR family transcriptional regulator|nr:GntR family transcriptional regulator, transcriptional repressor for pyruvate dehydrogenase complex [Abditibacteriota bacterium]